MRRVAVAALAILGGVVLVATGARGAPAPVDATASESNERAPGHVLRGSALR